MARLVKLKHCNHLAIFFGIFAYYYLTCISVTQAKDTLGVNESFVLLYGDFLESSNQRFRLIIISPANWTYFLAIQYVYMNQSIDIWAHNNYQTPARKEPAYLIMNADGRLVVDDSLNTQLFIVNAEQSAMINSTTATLLDNGNLVLRAAGGITVWQSFDYPCNTWLQGMKVGIFDLNTRSRAPMQSLLTSLQTSEEPNSTFGLDRNSTKELIVMQDDVVYWRSGIWDGLKFVFLDFSDRFGVVFSYFSNANESYFTWNSSTDPYALLVFTITGNITVLSGDFGANQSMAVCDEIDENKGKDKSMGCTNPCGGGDGFNQILGELDVWDEHTYSDKPLAGCKLKCRKNCLCYAYSYITYDNGGWGCKTTRSRIGKFLSSDKQRIFVRDSFNLPREGNSTPSPGLAPRTSLPLAPRTSPALAPSPLSVIDPIPSERKKSKKWKVTISISIGVLATFLGALILLYLVCHQQSRNADHRGLRKFNDAKRLVLGDKRVNEESPFFNFTSIEVATNHFSDENKLGQGGFGPVYKGKLHDGQVIAVKRLNRMSGYGIEQFKNEVRVISKLQHRNLVKLLGYCIHREERILIYEYLPNNSLDSIIFDSEKRTILNWKQRLHIIDGVAQGLLYLHKYSRLKIIHRDLKTSNVLLDDDLNPKISDFGTARIFGDNESHANTKKIVGTYGYMSPEYAMNGIISVKSDVYSFGVMMLEIISGKKNGSFSDSDEHWNLIGCVWSLWTEGRVSEIADPGLGEIVSIDEITKCVQLGLLCVQENAADRPTMSDVVSMLNNGVESNSTHTFTLSKGKLLPDKFDIHDKGNLSGNAPKASQSQSLDPRVRCVN